MVLKCVCCCKTICLLYRLIRIPSKARHMLGQCLLTIGMLPVLGSNHHSCDLTPLMDIWFIWRQILKWPLMIPISWHLCSVSPSMWASLGTHF